MDVYTKRILRFLEHPATVRFFRKHGIDPEKLRDDVLWVFKNKKDLKIPVRRTKRADFVSIDYIALRIPEERETASSPNIPEQPSLSSLNEFFYLPTTEKARKILYLLLTLATARHFLEKFGDVPKIFGGSIALLRAAHEGKESILEQVYKTKKAIKEDKLWAEDMEILLRELEALAFEVDPEAYLAKLRKITGRFRA